MSILLGILASVLPHMLCKKLCLHPSARTPQQILRFFYLGVGLKYISVVVLLSLMLLIPGVQQAIILAAFIGTQLASMLTRILIK